MTALRPYPKYKPSGVPWLGDVPGTWELRRTKTILWERCEKGHPEEPLLAATQTKGVVRKEQYETRTVVAQKDLHLLKLVRIGDFVISLRSFQGGIEYARERGIISPAYTVLYPREPDTHGYLSWLFKSKPYVDNLTLYVTGIREGQNIDYEKLSRSELPLPPSGERANIVRYLDHVDRRIRKYIRAKQKLIALLNEQKQAIIHRAVTGQIDVRTGQPYPKYKSSGVPWLGDVPEHWEARKLKALSSRVTKGTTPTSIGRDFTDAGIRFIKVESISKLGRVLHDRCAHIDATTDRLLARSRVCAGDVLVAIAGAIGRVGIVSLDDLPANTNQAVGIITPLGLSSEWLALALASPACQQALTDSAVQSAQANLSLTELAATMVPVPPKAERETIVRAVAEATGKTDSVSALAEREVALVREYRTRLVADVVTGKLDVREAAANLPEEPEEAEEPELPSEGEQAEGTDEAEQSAQDEEAA